MDRKDFYKIMLLEKVAQYELDNPGEVLTKEAVDFPIHYARLFTHALPLAAFAIPAGIGSIGYLAHRGYTKREQEHQRRLKQIQKRLHTIGGSASY